jgi:Beta propeller domain
MRRPAAVAAASLAALAVSAGAGSTSAAREAKPRPEQGFRLVRFGSCDELLRTSKAHANRLMRPWGLPRFPKDLPRATSFTPGPRRPGIDYSTTNVQEEGIDEPDIVKTNGSVVFSVRGNRLYSADVDGPLAILGTIRMESQIHELLLRRNRLLVLSRRRYSAYRPASGSPRRLPPYENAKTTLTEVDVTNPAAMHVVRTLTLDGHYVAGRLHGNVVRAVVSSAMPDHLQSGTTIEENRALVDASPLQHWLPGYELEGPN